MLKFVPVDLILSKHRVNGRARVRDVSLDRPIKVRETVQGLVVVDGRHRLEKMIDDGWPMVEVEIVC